MAPADNHGRSQRASKKAQAAPVAQTGSSGTSVARRVLVVALIALVASPWLLLNLGDQRLWQDEAQTALIAGTVLVHGIPLGHDSLNSFSQDGGQDYGPGYVWRWHPWLPFYVLAGFFAALGKGTFVARLPFALFGIATIVLAASWARSLWESQRAAIWASVVLLLNVPFLILARQCRYYALDMFLPLLALHGYVRLLERRRLAALEFGLGAIALFHTHYVHYGALIVAVIAHAPVFRRDRIRAVLVACAATLLLNLPWIMWFSAMGSQIADFGHAGTRAVHFAGQYLRDLERFALPVALLAAAILLWIMQAWSRKPRVAPAGPRVSHVVLLLLFVCAVLVSESLASTYPFFRNVAPALPVCALISALVLEMLARTHRIVGPILAVVVLGILAQGWRVPDYFYEITHHYRGPVDGIVEYLQAHAKRTDVVAITYEDLPVKFYTGLRVVGGLTGEDLSPAATAEWIIIRRYAASERDLAVREFLLSHVSGSDYTAISIDAPDIPYQNREEFGQHLFRTAKAPPVIIFRRIATSGG